MHKFVGVEFRVLDCLRNTEKKTFLLAVKEEGNDSATHKIQLDCGQVPQLADAFTSGCLYDHIFKFVIKDNDLLLAMRGIGVSLEPCPISLFGAIVKVDGEEISRVFNRYYSVRHDPFFAAQGQYSAVLFYHTDKDPTITFTAVCTVDEKCMELPKLERHELLKSFGCEDFDGVLELEQDYRIWKKRKELGRDLTYDEANKARFEDYPFKPEERERRRAEYETIKTKGE